MTPYNLTTEKEYKGGNIDRLMEACSENGWKVPAFCTFNQARKAGMKVIKGSKGTRIGYFDKNSVEEVEDKKTGKMVKKAVQKTFVVFNEAQLEELEG